MNLSFCTETGWVCVQLFVMLSVVMWQWISCSHHDGFSVWRWPDQQIYYTCRCGHL